MTNYKQFNAKTRYGFVVNFDTQKRRKYSDEQEAEIVQLKRWCLTIREIAYRMKIPFGSIHYILRKHGEIMYEKPRPHRDYLDVKQFEYLYGLTESQFYYATRRYKHLVKCTGKRVYLHYSYYQEYIFDKKAYKDSEENKRQEKQHGHSKRNS